MGRFRAVASRGPASRGLASRWLALTVLCAAMMMMIILDGTIVTGALSAIQRDLGFSASGLAAAVLRPGASERRAGSPEQPGRADRLRPAADRRVAR